MANPIRLDVISDPVCPWCYIGKTNLERALAQRPDHPFVIEWHPFMLNPDMPAGGADRASYMAEKFGGAEKVKAAHERLGQIAAAAGLDIAFDKATRMPNTLNAHRLVHWAGLEARQGAVVSALFDAYWQKGLDIGDAEVLADIAADAGMDRDVVMRLLASDADADAISDRAAHSRSRGVQGVPTFIVAERHAVSGAQPVDVWLSVIDELSAAAT